MGTACGPRARCATGPAAEFGDVRIGFFGLTSKDALSVELSDEIAAVGLEKLGLAEGKAEGRAAVVDQLVKQREQARDAAFAEVRAASGSPAGLLSYFFGLPDLPQLLG